MTFKVSYKEHTVFVRLPAGARSKIERSGKGEDIWATEFLFTARRPARRSIVLATPVRLTPFKLPVLGKY